MCWDRQRAGPRGSLGERGGIVLANDPSLERGTVSEIVDGGWVGTGKQDGECALDATVDTRTPCPPPPVVKISHED